MSAESLIEDFSFLGEWEERYRYVIELGQTLAPLSEAEHSPENKVQGCVSQVWLVHEAERGDGEPRLTFRGDSDAHIVRGLIAILLDIYNGKTPSQILDIDAKDILARLGLEEHLSPQRSNGLHAMVQRIRSDASSELAPAAS